MFTKYPSKQVTPCPIRWLLTPALQWSSITTASQRGSKCDGHPNLPTRFRSRRLLTSLTNNRQMRSLLTCLRGRCNRQRRVQVFCDLPADTPNRAVRVAVCHWDMNVKVAVPECPTMKVAAMVPHHGSPSSPTICTPTRVPPQRPTTPR